LLSRTPEQNGYYPRRARQKIPSHNAEQSTRKMVPTINCARHRRSSDVKKFLILTAAFGEGHNAAGRGIRDALRQLAPDAHIELRDIFAETFGVLSDLTCRAYLQLINYAPQVWSWLYSAIDEREQVRRALRWLAPARYRLAQIIARDQPDVIVPVYPAYAHFLDQILGPARGTKPRRIICITDSISINAVWFRCSADWFLVPNERTAAVLERAGVARGRLRVLGFPVSPAFAALDACRSAQPPWRVLYMINSGKASAAGLVQRLATLSQLQLTVTVGRDEKLRRTVESLRTVTGRNFDVIGWTSQLPELLARQHLLISKAGGATVQEAIAAGCPMIINQIVPGQEEGNAQLISETGCGCIALSNDEVLRAIGSAMQDRGEKLRQWSRNIGGISRPAAALDVAEFLLEQSDCPSKRNCNHPAEFPASDNSRNGLTVRQKLSKRSENSIS
jgi:processive 1,2-diacylglycerol beta-glucosyltransferase